MAAPGGLGGGDDDLFRFGLGPYRVVAAEGAVVRFGERLGSFAVGSLKCGDVIEVVEVLRLDDEQTIRARLAQPTGWITAKRGLGGACLEPLRTPSPLVASAAAQPRRIAEAPASAAIAGSRRAAASAAASAASSAPQRRPSAEEEVRAHLEELELGHFFPAFVSQGFDRLDAVRAMREEDMAKVGMKPGHIRLLQQRLALLEEFEASLTASFEEAKERGGVEGELQAQVEELIRQREEESQRAGQDFVAHLITKQELDYTREQLATARSRLAALERLKTSGSQGAGEPLDDAPVPGLEELVVY